MKRRTFTKRRKWPKRSGPLLTVAEYAERMAANPTKAEAILRDRLAAPDVGAKFLFQFPVLGFIPDFYCDDHRLIVEVDGRFHQGKRGRKSDAKRTAVFEANGIRVLRFWNSRVERDLEGVVAEIVGQLNWTKRATARWFAGLPEGEYW